MVAPELVEPTESTESTPSATEAPQEESTQEEPTQEESTQTTPSHNFSMKNKKSELVDAVTALGESASGKTKEQLLAILDKKS